ncbi:capsule assembly Wzi family protein [Cyclobacterium plantarum]|uniref:Capsule assembly Wzi family protein n=1 Tax=Cyclobacterium plantarum TaxID=2716263 RepID=A0ABX0HDC6_9BACT|nr:capsule assembly Wzi family protein [Cyclobacterium plantarum]NHE59320.1 capsule assembly Wzi family protein [Cyclobacterium plantarum]
MRRTLFFLLILLSVNSYQIQAQVIAGEPMLEEVGRRAQLLNQGNNEASFTIRPFALTLADLLEGDSLAAGREIKENWKLLPLRASLGHSGSRPYGAFPYLTVPARGPQLWLNPGVQYNKDNWLEFRFQPELVLAANSSFDGFPDIYGRATNLTYFRYPNTLNFPERFNQGALLRLGWGQSKLAAHWRNWEASLSTQSIWWGPGQFQSLIFSHHAPGFPHLSLGSRAPLTTFLGSFETQLLFGRLQSTAYKPVQDESLNQQFYRPHRKDARYLNALILTWSPKWLSGLSLGFSRTFQIHNSDRPSGFRAMVPVLLPLIKENYGFTNANGNWDQQVAVFGRWLLPKVQAELYFEYGRRDHALNWREFMLNPEHARAYLTGFTKIWSMEKGHFQIRGEMTRQQESINRLVRYSGNAGATWHSHSQLRGFTHRGEPLGVGLGPGSNIQTLEFAYLQGWKKTGIRLERVGRNEDFFYAAKSGSPDLAPWTDLALALLWERKVGNINVSATGQFIHSHHYQWQEADGLSTNFNMQLHMVYHW